MKFRTLQPVAPFALSIAGFQEFYPCSRQTIYNAIRSGELASFRDGRRRLIPLDGERGAIAYARSRAERGGAVPPEVSAQRAAAGRKGRRVQLAEADE